MGHGQISEGIAHSLRVPLSFCVYHEVPQASFAWGYSKAGKGSDSREICASEDVEIVKGNVSRDHVHLMVSAPPQVSPSRIMKVVKGKSSHHLVREFRTLQREFWGQHLWGRGYFGCSTGNVTDEVIKECIELQGKLPQDDQNFKITE